LRKKNYCILLLLFVTTLAYFNCLQNSFHFDDSVSIVENSVLKEPGDFWQSFRTGSLKTTILSFFLLRPLVQASFLLNYQLGGLNVFGYHLFNIGVHCLVVIAIFFLAQYLKPSRSEISPCRGGGDQARIFPWIAALVFGIYPVFTESVVYISSRSALLVTLFFVLSFLFFLRYCYSFRSFLFLPLFGALLLGLAAKKNFIVFPAVIPIYLLTYHASGIGAFIKRHRLAVWTLLVLLSVPFALLIHKMAASALGPIAMQWTPVQYFLTELNVMVFYYLKEFLFPFGLSIDPLFPVSSAFFSVSLLSFCVLLGVVAWALSVRKSRSLVCFGILWFFVTLAPSSSFVPLLDFVAEHRLYLPGVGFILILSQWLVGYKKARWLPLLCIPILFVITAHRNFAWRTPETIWYDAMIKSPHKARPHHNLARYYQETGRLDDAIREYKRASAIVTDVPYPYIGIGTVYLKKGDLDMAEKSYKKALDLQPYEAVATEKLAEVYFKRGEYDRAEKWLTSKNKAGGSIISFDSDHYDAFYLLGQIYSMQGKNGAALRQFQRAVTVNRDFAEGYVGLGIVFARNGKGELAERNFLRSIAVRKENPPAYLNLGYLYFNQKKYRQALVQYKKALRYDPESQRTRIYAGDAYFALRDFSEAIRNYGLAEKKGGELRHEAIIKIGLSDLETGGSAKADAYFSSLALSKAEDANLYLQMGKIFEERGHGDLAYQCYTRAAELDPGHIRIEKNPRGLSGGGGTGGIDP